MALAASRFIPHPPNFTSLIALSFYVPALLGRKFIPAVMGSFLLTDIVIGFHNVTFFTWGSVFIIGILSSYFTSSTVLRISGAVSGAIIFFILTNLGVWLMGSYGYTINGLLACYTLALPFFGYTILSTLVFSLLIEALHIFYKKKNLSKILSNWEFLKF